MTLRGSKLTCNLSFIDMILIAAKKQAKAAAGPAQQQQYCVIGLWLWVEGSSVKCGARGIFDD